jgi:hypothetical protein
MTLAYKPDPGRVGSADLSSASDAATDERPSLGYARLVIFDAARKLASARGHQLTNFIRSDQATGWVAECRTCALWINVYVPRSGGQFTDDPITGRASHQDCPRRRPF